MPKRQKKKKKENTRPNYFPGVKRPIYEEELALIRDETYDIHVSWNKPCVVLLLLL